MHSITQTFSLCYGHRLLGETGKPAQVHGHTATVVLTLQNGGLNERGQVYPKSRVEETLGSWINKELDHSLILCNTDPLLPSLNHLGERVYVMTENPTEENIARMIYHRASDFGLPVESVEVWDTENTRAVYTSDDETTTGTPNT
jgi:6-pyruvoyltetrahydropterin/6-carboxytetrahydropterin synthase